MAMQRVREAAEKVKIELFTSITLILIYHIKLQQMKFRNI